MLACSLAAISGRSLHYALPHVLHMTSTSIWAGLRGSRIFLAIVRVLLDSPPPELRSLLTSRKPGLIRHIPFSSSGIWHLGGEGLRYLQTASFLSLRRVAVEFAQTITYLGMVFHRDHCLLSLPPVRSSSRYTRSQGTRRLLLLPGD